MLHIYCVTNVGGGKFFGDRNQVVAIKNSLEHLLSSCDVATHEIDVDDVEKLAQYISQDTGTAIVVASGDHGIEFISLFGSKGGSENIVTIWSGHQTFSQLLRVNLEHFNFIALPEYSLKAELIERANGVSNIIRVPTVPMIIDFSDNRLAYENFSLKSLMPDTAKYLMVFLGGDAPDENGLMNKILDYEMENFALYAFHLATSKSLEIIVSNNPRTTKDQADIFFQKLHEYKTEVVYFNFHEGIRAYKPLLHLLKNTDSVAMISGESTSMVDEIVYISGKPAYVMAVSSMSNVHRTHVEYEKGLGNVRVIDTAEFNQDIPVLNERVSFDQGAAEIIAGEVLSKSNHLSWF